jgi:pseudaminic acid biosynthesis-associated methylase
MGMTEHEDQRAEATRLEELWAGDFGDDYVERNLGAYDHREPFWASMMTELRPNRVLEVGANVGGNLQWIAQHVEPGSVCGVDVNRKALELLHQRVPGVSSMWTPARELPFRDGWFDLVFTMGVLIHQPTSTLPLVMAEMVRCSRRWVLCGEYFGEETTEVPYRGHEGALFRRDYGRQFRELFPSLRLVREGTLTKDEGWDDVTWWLLEKAES